MIKCTFGQFVLGKRYFGIGLCVLATFGPFALIEYANSGCPIKLVIPNDYVGEISMTWDYQGIPPKFEGGCWVYRFGDDGRLLTSNLRPFTRWHKEQAEFRDGRVIHCPGYDSYTESTYTMIEGGMSTNADAHQWTVGLTRMRTMGRVYK